MLTPLHGCKAQELKDGGGVQSAHNPVAYFLEPFQASQNSATMATNARAKRNPVRSVPA